MRPPVETPMRYLDPVPGGGFRCIGCGGRVRPGRRDPCDCPGHGISPGAARRPAARPAAPEVPPNPAEYGIAHPRAFACVYCGTEHAPGGDCRFGADIACCGEVGHVEPVESLPPRGYANKPSLGAQGRVTVYPDGVRLIEDGPGRRLAFFTGPYAAVNDKYADYLHAYPPERWGTAVAWRCAFDHTYEGGGLELAVQRLPAAD